jgi:hypothetical protein
LREVITHAQRRLHFKACTAVTEPSDGSSETPAPMTFDNMAFEVSNMNGFVSVGAIFHTGDMERERADREMSNTEQTLRVVGAVI